MELWAIVPELVLGGAVLVLLPLGSFLPQGHRRLATAVALAGLAAAAAAAARMLGWPARAVFEGTYAVDPFAVYFKLLAIAATALVLLSTVSFFRHTPREGQIPALLVLCCLGMVGLSASQDLALIALFLQLVTVSSYVLVGSLKTSRPAAEGALKLFLFSASAGAIMIYGMALLYGLTGTLAVPELAPSLARAPAAVALIAAALVLAGYGFKITLVPFHGWAPDTYQGAATSIAGYLAVGPKAAALAVLARTLFVASGSRAWQPWIAAIAVLTMTAGNLLALPQTSLKRLLAWSSIAQAGYLVVGIAAASKLGTSGLMLYLAVYLFMNLAAFLAVDGLERRYGTDEMERLHGAGRRAPLTSAALALAILSLAGVPPLGGFVGKTVLLGAALDSGLLWVAVAMAVNFVLSLAYYARVLEALYLRTPQHGPSGRLPPGLSIALTVLVAGTLASGVVPQRLVAFTAKAATLLAGH